MKHKQNLHTHTTYCDGKDTAEELILHAKSLGFDSLGFSGHSYMHYAPTHSMSLQGTEAYKAEINSLKNKYKNEIDIFCGLEFDMYSEIDLSGYDYLIGSVHFLLIDGEYIAFDRTAKDVKFIIDNYFDGKGISYAKAYYETLCKLPQYGNFDILGHFDLITKHCDTDNFFDQDSDEYIKAAVEAAEALGSKIPFFEVNTGAIARGYRKSPYPSRYLLRELKRIGYGAVITSDCHDKNMLDCEFDTAAEILRDCGFTEKYVLTNNGFESAEL